MITTKPVDSAAPPRLLIKVCGMRERENTAALLSLEPDLIGLIFYPKSARFAGEVAEVDYVRQLPAATQKVGVFVNESLENILATAQRYQLQAIQLHGEETPELCAQLRAANYTVLKAFAVDETFDFNQLRAYEGTCDYFLFDTKGPQYGGNGVAFNWNILDRYASATPFFLSGGLDLTHVAAIKAGRWPQLRSLDLNSRFELSPGLKDIPKIAQMMVAVRA